MTTLFYDSVSASAMPAGSLACLYSDGNYAAPESDASRFQSVNWITVEGGTASAATEAIIADYETGNPVYTAGNLAAWAEDRLSHGEAAIVYANRSDLPAAVAALGSHAAQVLWWVPTADNKQWTQADLLANIHSAGSAAVNAVVTSESLWACQYAWEAAYDVSVLYGEWKPSPVISPAPAPAPAPSDNSSTEDNCMELKTGKGAADAIRFPVWPSFLFFLTDVSGLNGGTPVTIRVALHNSGSDWDVKTVTLTTAEPSYIMTLPQDNTKADGAVFTREDDGPVVAVSWR